MKKILCNILALSMILGGLTACKVNNASNTDSSSSYQDSTQGGAGGSSDKEQDSTQSGSGGSSGEEQGGEQEKEGIDIILGNYSSFAEGRAKVAYYENGEKRYALIDTQGNYLYDVPTSWEHIGKGAGYATKWDEEGDLVYEIINSQGEVVANSKEMGFDEILSYGEGKVLVYQYKSTLTSVEYLYGVVNGEDGSWAQPLRDAGKYHWDYDYVYCGEGMFLSDSGSRSREYRVYNSNTNRIYTLEAWSGNSEIGVAEKKFINGVMYGTSDSGHITYSDGTSEVLPAYFALHADGTYEEVEKFSAVSNGKIIRNISKENAYVEIYDPATDKTIEYKDYPANMVQSIDFTQKYGLVILKGIDWTRYFTLIDDNGVQQFEPIAGYSDYKYDGTIDYLEYSDGVIVYSVEAHDSQYTPYNYTAVNEKGEFLFEKKNWREIYGKIKDGLRGFSDGIALGYVADLGDWVFMYDYFYINEKGETVLTKMFKK